jgi:hypothetical protein
VTFTLWPEMFASVSRVVMASRRHPSRWLAVRSEHPRHRSASDRCG